MKYHGSVLIVLLNGCQIGAVLYDNNLNPECS